MSLYRRLTYIDVVRIACTTGELIISNYTGASGLVYSPGEIHQLVRRASDGNCNKPEKFLVPRIKRTGHKRNRKKELSNVQKFNIVRVAKSR